MLIDFLPTVYRSNNVIQYIYTYLNELEIDYLNDIENFKSDFLITETATSIGLDFQAELNGLTSLFWSKSWTVEQKRMLILNYAKLISERGNKDLINWLFDVFDFNAQLTSNSGWILNVTPFNIEFSDDIFSYKIKIASNYTIGSPERKTIDQIINVFIPDFISITIETF